MECEQCQIAQASTIRETETATGLIYYWRKTEIKCSATACETYGDSRCANNFCPAFPFRYFPTAFPIFSPFPSILVCSRDIDNVPGSSRIVKTTGSSRSSFASALATSYAKFSRNATVAFANIYARRKRGDDSRGDQIRSRVRSAVSSILDRFALDKTRLTTVMG